MDAAAKTGAGDLLTQTIIHCFIEVHQVLGPGFLESVYRRALVAELRIRGLDVQTEAEVAICYKGIVVGRHRLDLLVDGRVIVEAKAVEALTKAHYRQVRSYLQATGLQVALLANFNGDRADYRRIVRGSRGSRGDYGDLVSGHRGDHEDSEGTKAT